VVAGGLIEEAGAVQHRPAFGVLRREDHARYAGQAHRPGAHGAGFERDIERGAAEPFIPERRRAGAQHQHFGVGGGIVALDDAVAVLGQERAVRRQQHGADGHFAAQSGGFCFGDGECYGFVVIHGAAYPLPDDTTQDAERISKMMARAGVCSRRDAEKLIAEGRVALNGELVREQGTKATTDDLITLDGKPVLEPEPTRLWRYHKPAGLVTTHRDEKGRPTVFANLPKNMPRVVSVGRLDVNSEGLLLLTNDGALARQLELPAAGWQRKYRVRLFGKVRQEDLDKLKKGRVVDRVKYAPVTAELERAKGMYAWANVTLTEGKNREVKRLMESLGLKVARLIRVQYGPFHLGHLEENGVEEIAARIWREQLGIKKPKKKE